MAFQNRDNCIFCLDGNLPGQALIHNTGCQCKFTYHSSCFQRYNKTECPLCKRQMIQNLHITVAVSSRPTTGKIVRSVPQTSSQVLASRTPLLSSTIVATGAAATAGASATQKKLFQVLCTVGICGLIIFSILYVIIWLNTADSNE